MYSLWEEAVPLWVAISERVDGRWMPQSAWRLLVIAVPQLMRYLRKYLCLVVAARLRFPEMKVDVLGIKDFWLNGKLHRVDGPAIEAPKYKEWWVNGKRQSVLSLFIT